MKTKKEHFSCFCRSLLVFGAEEDEVGRKGATFFYVQDNRKNKKKLRIVQFNVKTLFTDFTKYKKKFVIGNNNYKNKDELMIHFNEIVKEINDKKNRLQTIKSSMDKLNAVFQAASADMYNNAGGGCKVERAGFALYSGIENYSSAFGKGRL